MKADDEMSIKILIADDHALLRQGVKRILSFEDDLEVVGEAEDGQEALDRKLKLHPDSRRLEMHVPGLTGMEVTKRLSEANSSTRVIALTMHDSDNYVLEMLKNGARGYLLKDVEPEVLIKTIYTVHEGKAFICQQIAERLFGSLKETDDIEQVAREMWNEGRKERITAREMDVLQCIAKGFSNQDIGKALNLSEKTVKNHLTSIFHKLKVNDRTQALIYALKNKLLTIE